MHVFTPTLRSVHRCVGSLDAGGRWRHDFRTSNSNNPSHPVHTDPPLCSQVRWIARRWRALGACLQRESHSTNPSYPVHTDPPLCSQVRWIARRWRALGAWPLPRWASATEWRSPTRGGPTLPLGVCPWACSVCVSGSVPCACVRVCSLSYINRENFGSNPYKICLFHYVLYYYYVSTDASGDGSNPTRGAPTRLQGVCPWACSAKCLCECGNFGGLNPPTDNSSFYFITITITHSSRAIRSKVQHVGGGRAFRGSVHGRVVFCGADQFPVRVCACALCCI